MRYDKLASHLIEASYTLASGEALTVSELLVRFGSEEMVDLILGDEARIGQRMDKLTSEIRATIDTYEQKRMGCPLVESSIAHASFKFQYVDDDSLAEDDRDWRAKQRCRPALEAELQRLNDRAFEAVCGTILSELGCRHVTVTQSSKDDGVDVIAHLPITDPLEVIGHFGIYHLLGGRNFLVYGQAKRYSATSKVGQEEVQRLLGSWLSVQAAYFQGTLAPDRSVALKRTAYRPADPVLLMMLTTSSFTSGAMIKAEDLGILLVDGKQLANLLAGLSLGVKRQSASYAVDLNSLIR